MSILKEVFFNIIFFFNDQVVYCPRISNCCFVGTSGYQWYFYEINNLKCFLWALHQMDTSHKAKGFRKHPIWRNRLD